MNIVIYLIECLEKAGLTIEGVVYLFFSLIFIILIFDIFRILSKKEQTVAGFISEQAEILPSTCRKLLQGDRKIKNYDDYITAVGNPRPKNYEEARQAILNGTLEILDPHTYLPAHIGRSK